MCSKIRRDAVRIGCAIMLAAGVATTCHTAQAGELWSLARGYVCHATDAPPVVDGRLDDSCWSGAEVAGGFAVRGGGYADLAPVQTRVRFCRDDEALYFSVQCDEPSAELLPRGPRRRDADVYEDGCVMLLFDSGHDGEGGTDIEIAFDAAGTQYDFGWNMRELWDGEWTCATEIGAQSWAAELRIPFTDLREEPADGDIWGVQVGRWRIADSEEQVSLWSPVPQEWYTKLWVAPTFGHLLFGHRDDMAAEYVAQVARGIDSAARETEKTLSEIGAPEDVATFRALSRRLGKIEARTAARPGLTGDEWAGAMREADEIAAELSDFVWPLLSAAILAESAADRSRLAGQIRAESASEGLAYEDFLRLDVDADHQLSDNFPTPHVDWAAPLPGGPVKALFLVQIGAGDAGNEPSTRVREVVELGQRVEMQYDAAFVCGSRLYGGKRGHARVARLLARDYDVIVMANASLAALAPQEQHAILRKVADGAGLLLVGEQPDWLLAGVDRDATSQIPTGLDAAPEIAFADGETPLARQVHTCRIGSGRVVQVSYPNRDLLSLTPRLPYAPANVNAYEYHMAFTVRALLWAAHRALPVELTAMPLQGRRIPRVRLPRELTIARGGPRGMERFDLGASVRRLDTGERVAVKRLRWDDANGAMRLLGSMPLLPAGRYLLELRAEVGGAAAGFASADFEIVTDVDAPQVTLTRDFVELGEAVTGSVRTHGDHIRAGDEVVIRVRDCYERSIAEWCRPAAPRVDFEWRATDAATVTMAIEASILRGGAEVISAQARFSVSRRHRGHWAQVMWDVPTDVLGYYGVQRLTEAGFNVNLRSGDPPDVVAAHNWSYIPYTTRVMDQFDGQGLMQPACWNDEPAIAQHVADIVSRQAAARRHGVYAYSLGDETTTRGACTHPSCLAAYRAWLVREYDDSIDALNAAWGSEYSSFEEIDLIGGGRYTGARLAYEEAGLDAGLYSRWADRQRFAQQNYVQLCARFGRAFNESDPWAVTGFEGAGNFGEDYAALATTNGFWAPYGGLGDEVLRSVAPRSMLRSNWIGYASEATPLIADAWRLVFNDCNSLFWWRWDNLGRFHGYLAPDLDLWPATRDLTEEMRIMRDGLGDWLMGADRQHDGIAIFYSVSSALATRTPPGAAIGDCERSHLAATLATADLGMGYDYITDEQVANGALRGGQYRVLWMPCTLAVSNEAAAAIAEFASSGGAIVADVAPGMWDEHLAPVERPALRRVFEPGGAGHLLGPEFAKYRDVRETVEGAAIRARLQDVCEETGVAPAVRLTYLDGPGWGVRMVRWRRGEIEVVGLLQLPLGTYDGAPLPPPATVRLALPERKHVSDVRSRSYLGVRDEIEVQLTPARAQFLVLLRREPQPLDVSAEPRVVEAGQPVRVTVSVPDGMRPRVVRLAVRSLSGRTAPWFSRTITVAHGGERVALQTAFNDERGVWTVSATDLLGRTADAEFQVR